MVAIAEYFEELSRCDDQFVNLAEAALVLASHRYPELAQEQYLMQLDGLAERVRGHRPSSLDHWRRALNNVLFDETGFKGNASDYYDPRNSYLNDVLDRQLGIPITLSLVYMEVGSRCGLSLEPISFPGHFLVRLSGGGGQGLVVDPFNGGKVLAPPELEQQLRRTFGPEAASGIAIEDVLAPVPRREVLSRILRNLIAIYDKNSDDSELLSVADLAVRLVPEGANERRTRGLAYLKIGHVEAARTDLERYRQQMPNASDARQIDELLGRIGSGPPGLN
jgi:regulator of sirC expression with transglutaminase-like and TPR domain